MKTSQFFARRVLGRWRHWALCAPSRFELPNKCTASAHRRQRLCRSLQPDAPGVACPAAQGKGQNGARAEARTRPAHNSGATALVFRNKENEKTVAYDCVRVGMPIAMVSGRRPWRAGPRYPVSPFRTPDGARRLRSGGVTTNNRAAGASKTGRLALGRDRVAGYVRGRTDQ
jgi:hypothetical protein